jgi:hypothetical protein
VLDTRDSSPVVPPARDGVAGLETGEQPTIVSISDIHGYLASARSALLAVGNHPDYEPIVEADAARRLQWAGGEEYVLVFNGDLVDRGPHSADVVGMVERLIEQAPTGHVRVTVGNHELCAVTPAIYSWSDWYVAQQGDDERLAFLRAIRDGHVVAAYEGYSVAYAHAGQPDPYDVEGLNDALVAAADEVSGAIGTDEDPTVQESVTESYPRVFGFDGRTGRGPDAGIAWLDFEFMPEDAPPQVVGHTIQRSPARRGSVVCQNVIRKNRRADGGEAVFVETPDRLAAIVRTEDGGVTDREFPLPG